MPSIYKGPYISYMKRGAILFRRFMNWKLMIGFMYCVNHMIYHQFSTHLVFSFVLCINFFYVVYLPSKIRSPFWARPVCDSWCLPQDALYVVGLYFRSLILVFPGWSCLCTMHKPCHSGGAISLWFPSSCVPVYWPSMRESVVWESFLFKLHRFGS